MNKEGKHDEQIVSYCALGYTCVSWWLQYNLCSDDILQQHNLVPEILHGKKIHELNSGVTNCKKTPHTGAEGDKLTFLNTHFDVFLFVCLFDVFQRKVQFAHFHVSLRTWLLVCTTCIKIMSRILVIDSHRYGVESFSSVTQIEYFWKSSWIRYRGRSRILD